MRPEELTAEQVATIAEAIAYAVRCIGARGREDFAQDLWVAILTELPGYEPQQSALITWAALIARYRLIDRLRREGSRRAQRRGPRPQPLPTDDRAELTVAAGGPGPLAQAIEREELARLVRRLSFSRTDRLILALLSAGYSQEAIGRVVGVSPSRVSQFVGSFRAVLL